MSSSKTVFDVMSPGPYPVGVINTVFVDANRLDPYTGEPRTLVTEIWYPAADEARGLPKNEYTDFLLTEVTPEVEELTYIPGPNPYHVSVEFLSSRYRTEAVRDAPVREGRFPLVVFSHSTNGYRFQSTFWCDYLASHGYVVVAPDHTGNARFSIVNGELIPYLPDENQNSIYDRPRDMMFLLDQLQLWDGGADARFAGRLDLEAACAAGHSFGSATAIAVATAEPRFKAVIGMACAYRSLPPNPTIPTLHMLAAEDRFIGEAGNETIRWHQTLHTGPSFLLEMKNGGHLSFTDNVMLCDRPHEGVGPGTRHATDAPFEYTRAETAYQIINSYSVAFLGCYLKRRPEYMKFLRENHWPEEVLWEVRGLEAEQV
jgi:dienelactone hydrolase